MRKSLRGGLYAKSLKSRVREAAILALAVFVLASLAVFCAVKIWIAFRDGVVLGRYGALVHRSTHRATFAYWVFVYGGAALVTGLAAPSIIVFSVLFGPKDERRLTDHLRRQGELEPEDSAAHIAKPFPREIRPAPRSPGNRS